MSIKVGYLNEKYTFNNLNNINSTVILNSFTDSNVIMINPDDNTTSNMFINYKKKFMTGLADDTYIFKTYQENLLTLNSNNINLYKPTFINDNINVNNLIYTLNQKTYINSNLNINFIAPSDSFSVADILKISSNRDIDYDIVNMSIKNGSNNIMQINQSNINISNNLFIYNGTMYVNKISGINGPLNIGNATYNSTVVEQFTASKNVSIINSLSNNFDIIPFEVYKNYGTKDIISINSSNISGGITNNFIINKNGQIGIGIRNPDAILNIKNISDVNSNILMYNGISSGDTFKITNRANVGIGTQQPNAQLHIRRNDDLLNNEFRSSPMMYIDMNYDAFKNISNIYKINNTTLTTESMTIYPNINITSNITTNGLNVFINSTFYLLNGSIFLSMQNNIKNISNVILPFPKTFELPVDVNLQPVSTVTNSITLTNNFIYPSSNTIHIQEIESLRSYSSTTFYQVNYVFLMMSMNTYNNGGYINNINDIRYNASNFTDYQNNTPYINKYNSAVYSIAEQSGSYDIKCKLDFIIEKNLIQNSGIRIPSYDFDYIGLTRVPLSAPDFLNISYNSNFISSISSYGTLSLGSRVPEADKQKYLLYVNGNSLINNIKVNGIDTNLVNSNISFNNKNIIDLNIVKCNDLQVTNLVMNNISLDGVVGNNIDFINGKFNNLTTSNFTFYKATNDFVSFSNINVHFNTNCSIGKIPEIGNSNMLKITVDNTINPTINEGTFYTRHNGILVWNNDTNINPSISVQTINSDSIPYIHLNNSSSGYYFRIIKNKYVDVPGISSGQTTTNFQITSDNFINSIRRNYYSNNKYVPHLFQHIKEYNLLTLGEQDIICIDCLNKNSVNRVNTNSSSKISIGVPFDAFSGSYAEKDYPQYFQDQINVSTNPYMLNIFGNIKIANINNNPIITAITNTVNSKVYTAINGHPDNVSTLRVYGDICSSNIKTYDNIESGNIISVNINASNIVISGDGLMTSSNIINKNNIYTNNIESSNINVSNIVMIGDGLMTSSNIINKNNIYTNNIESSNINASNIVMIGNDSKIQTSNLIIDNDIMIYIPSRGEYISLIQIITNNNLLNYLL
jgi:hypothetical protein